MIDAQEFLGRAVAAETIGAAEVVVRESDADDVDACREAALRLLDAAPRASGALRERLIAKGYAVGIVDEVIERLTRVHLLDDRAYAEALDREADQLMETYWKRAEEIYETVMGRYR